MDLPELRGTVTPEDSIFLDSGLVKGSTYKYTVAVLDGVHLKRAISSTFEITVKPSKRSGLFIYLVHTEQSRDGGKCSPCIY